jgi:hypothetical protein
VLSENENGVLDDTFNIAWRLTAERDYKGTTRYPFIISAREEKERKTLFPLFVALTFALSLAVVALAETKSDSARHNRSANVVWEFPAVNPL